MTILRKVLLSSIFLVSFYLILFPVPTHAASFFWVGGAGTWDNSTATHWASSSGGAGGAGHPGSSDTATFDGNSGGGTVTVGANLSVSGLSLTGATSSTITQGTNTITIGSGNYSQAGGTFTGGSATIADNGSFSLSGGTFTSTSGILQVVGSFTRSAGTFNHNSGTVLLTDTSNNTLTNTQAFNNLTINDGLVGYWKLDESSTGTSTDSSGYGNNGTDTGTTVSTNVPSVNFADSHSRSFNGTSDYISTNIPTQSFSAGTFSAWIYVNSFSQSTQAIFRGISTDAAGWEFVNGTSKTMAAWFNGNFLNQVSVNTSIAINTWAHVAVTYDGTTVRFYVNGSLVGSGNQSTNTPNAIGNLHIGANAGGTEFFHGNIDDLRIYNRALSATEIARLAAGNEPQTGVATYTLGGNLTVNNNLTLSTATLDTSSTNYAISVGGNWQNDGGIFTPESGTVTLTGTGSSNVIQSGGQSFYNLTQDGSGGTYSLNDALTATNACTISAGTLDSSSSNYNTTCGTWSDSGTFKPRTDTFTVTSTGTLSDPTSFYNVTLNAPSSTVTLGNNLTATNNFAITAGTLDVSASNYRVIAGGNFSNAGTFNARSGTLLLNSSNNTTFTPGSSTFSNVILNDGLVGYWKLDESSAGTSADSSGYGNNGTDTGTTASTNVPAVNFADSHSRSFNGVSDYVDVGSLPNLFNGVSSQSTVCAWIDPASVSSTLPFITKYNTQINGGYFSFQVQATGALASLYGQGGFGGGDPATDNYATTSNNVISPNTWSQVCTTQNVSTGTIQIYVNGVSQSVTMASDGTPPTAYPSDSAVDVNLGSFTNGAGNRKFYSGLVDDVRIYNRILSATEIARLAAGNEPQTGVAITTLGGSLTTNMNLVLSTGTLDSSSSNYSVSVGGNWEDDGGIFTPRSGTVTLTGNGSSGTLLSGGQSFYNLTQNGSGGTYTLNDNLSVTNACTITAGTLDVSPGNYHVAVGGNFSNNGIFTPRSGIVTLDGSNQSLSGSTTFYNVSKTVTNSDNLTLASGSTQTINAGGSLSLQGPAGSYLKVRSSSSGTSYTLNLTNLSNPSSEASVSNVDFQDATVQLANSQQLADTNGKDSGNNSGIVFAQQGGAAGSGGWTTSTVTTTPTMSTPTPSSTPSPSSTPTPNPTTPSPAPTPTLTPTPTPTVSQLKQAIAALYEKIRALVNLTPSTTQTPSALSSPFTRNLKPGNSDPDVARLQAYLNANGYVVSSTAGGPGSLGHETTYFGPATAAALTRFQEAHAAEILSPSGFKHGTGWFYDHTREYVNQLIQGDK